MLLASFRASLKSRACWLGRQPSTTRWHTLQPQLLPSRYLALMNSLCGICSWPMQTASNRHHTRHLAAHCDTSFPASKQLCNVTPSLPQLPCTSITSFCSYLTDSAGAGVGWVGGFVPLVPAPPHSAHGATEHACYTSVQSAATHTTTCGARRQLLQPKFTRIAMHAN